MSLTFCLFRIFYLSHINRVFEYKKSIKRINVKGVRNSHHIYLNKKNDIASVCKLVSPETGTIIVITLIINKLRIKYHLLVLHNREDCA